jgi:hypothetical protein|tara:strand:+ start:1563 stop:2300 length:738 start_codon:yes stop_codon:yes gene_type:complete
MASLTDILDNKIKSSGNKTILPDLKNEGNITKSHAVLALNNLFLSGTKESLGLKGDTLFNNFFKSSELNSITNVAQFVANKKEKYIVTKDWRKALPSLRKEKSTGGYGVVPSSQVIESFTNPDSSSRYAINNAQLITLPNGNVGIWDENDFPDPQKRRDMPFLKKLKSIYSPVKTSKGNVKSIINQDKLYDSLHRVMETFGTKEGYGNNLVIDLGKDFKIDSDFKKTLLNYKDIKDSKRIFKDFK